MAVVVDLQDFLAQAAVFRADGLTEDEARDLARRWTIP